MSAQAERRRPYVEAVQRSFMGYDEPIDTIENLTFIPGSIIDVYVKNRKVEERQRCIVLGRANSPQQRALLVQPVIFLINEQKLALLPKLSLGEGTVVSARSFTIPAGLQTA